MRNQAQVLLSVFQDPKLRRVAGAFGAFATAEEAMWLAVVVYAYQRGGMVEAGLVGFGLLLPVALLSPLAAFTSDRRQREHVLAGAYAMQALSLAAAAIAIAWNASPAAVYAVCALAYLPGAFAPPAMHALLPALTRTPEALTAANAATVMLENLGRLFGPLSAALLLFVGGPAQVFGAMAVLMLGAACALASLRIEAAAFAAPEHGSLTARILGGFHYLRGDADFLVLVACAASSSLLIGAIDVAVVAIAAELFGRGEHAAGYLSAAFALGGLFGAMCAVVLIGRRRLVPALLLGGLLMGAASAGLASASLLPLGLLLLFASGLGGGFADVAGTTLVQRTSPDRLRARVFGVLEGLRVLCLAVGAMLVSVASVSLGLPGTLVLVGLLLPALLLVSLPRLAAIDQSAEAPPARILASLRSDPIFAPLAPSAIERVAARASIVDAPTDAVIAREGEVGDRYYRVLAGELEVAIADRVVRRLGVGDSFGEIALLYAVPRTATVAALTPVTLVAVERSDFLTTVAGDSQSRAEAETVARRLLE